ncbi:TPA: hypothetical protein ACH3X1_010942 [Trebouxia sp. C0004]
MDQVDTSMVISKEEHGKCVVVSLDLCTTHGYVEEAHQQEIPQQHLAMASPQSQNIERKPHTATLVNFERLQEHCTIQGW